MNFICGANIAFAFFNLAIAAWQMSTGYFFLFNLIIGLLNVATAIWTYKRA